MSWANQANLIRVLQLLFTSLSYSRVSPRYSKDFLPFVWPQLPAPMASCTPISVGAWPLWALSTLLLLLPTKSAYSRLLPSKYQLSSWMSKVVLTMSEQTSWPKSSPKEVSPPTWSPGSSCSSPNANADSDSKERLRLSAQPRLAPFRAHRYVLFFLCFI